MNIWPVDPVYITFNVTACGPCTLNGITITSADVPGLDQYVTRHPGDAEPIIVDVNNPEDNQS